jgi:hypothetical protein
MRLPAPFAVCAAALTLGYVRSSAQPCYVVDDSTVMARGTGDILSPYLERRDGKWMMLRRVVTWVT